MEFKTRRTPTTNRFNRNRKSTRTTPLDLELQSKYSSNLTFYLDPPLDSISLKDFEEYAVARLKLLRIFERVNTTSHIRYTKPWLQEVRDEMSKLQLNQFLLIGTDSWSAITASGADKKTKWADPTPELIYECRKYDVVSHFILRLAFCRTEELRKWFVEMETEYFRFKLMYAQPDTQKEFLQLHNFKFDEVSREEITSINKQLANASPQYNAYMAANMDYFRVPFTRVLELVRTRHIYLQKGMAYVPRSHIGTIVGTEFRKMLSHCVALTRKALPEIQEDERLVRILTDFHKRYTGKSYDTKKGSSTSLSIEDLGHKSNTSFPLCMKSLYDVVQKDHHLKHFGRLQLGLFLKGAGLSMDEATKFWRTNFTKKPGMDSNQFDKQYLYNIRHMYGKEGKRADYTPYSCLKVIMSSVGTGDHHGCPFRHSDPTPLRARLLSAKIPENGVKEILRLVADRQYQLACQKHFELTHDGRSVDGGLHHPNQYYEESENVYLGSASTRKARVEVPTTRVNIYPPSQSQSQSNSESDAIEEDPEAEWEAVQNNQSNINSAENDILTQVSAEVSYEQSSNMDVVM